jgi:hypothetical protein
MSYLGRELLVKSVLTTLPTYFLTVYKMPKWVFSRIDRLRRSFMWKGQDPENVRGGTTLLTSKHACCPRS